MMVSTQPGEAAVTKVSAKLSFLPGERVFEGLALRAHAGAGGVVAHLGDRLGRVHDA